MAISKKILDFGKHKGETLGACEESYIKWLAQHPMRLREDHRHFAIASKALLERGKQVEYTTGQFIKSDKTGIVGKITGMDRWSYKVRTGEFSLSSIKREDAQASSETAYNEQIASEEAKLQVAKLTLRQKQQSAKTFRYVCLSCGTKHNGECACGGESILNSGQDGDNRMFGERAYSR